MGVLLPKVLVGFAESLAAIETVWNLIDEGFEVHAFSRSGAISGLARDRRVTIHHVSAPEADFSRTVQQITEVAEELQWPPLMPLDDVAVLLLSRLGEEKPHSTVVGPVGVLAEFTLDKRLQLDAAAKAGLDVPSTFIVVTEQNQIGAELPDFDAPWIVKPAFAVTVVDNRVVKGATEVANNAAELSVILSGRNDVVLIQPVITGIGRGVFGQACRGSVSNWSGHRRVRMMNPSGSGSSACRSTDPAPDLVEAAGRFIGSISWDGLFMLEFLADSEGTSWFMELNGRAWGSMILGTHRGFSYPAWSVRGATDQGFRAPQVRPTPHFTARHLGRELLHLLFVIRGRRRMRAHSKQGLSIDPLIAGYPSSATALRSVLRWSKGDRVYNARWGHLRVLSTDTFESIAAVVRSRVGHQ